MGVTRGSDITDVMLIYLLIVDVPLRLSHLHHAAEHKGGEL